MLQVACHKQTHASPRGRRLAFWPCLLGVLVACTLAIAPADAQSQTDANQPSVGTSGNAREQLNDVLSDPLYHRWERRQARQAWEEGNQNGTETSATDGFGQWLSDWWDKLFQRKQKKKKKQQAKSPSTSPTASSSSGSSKSGWGGALALGGVLQVVGWVVVILAVLLIAWLVAQAIRQRDPSRKKAKPSRQVLKTALSEGTALAAEADEWLDHANELAAENESPEDLRWAFRALYLALLSGLHSQGCIQFRKQRTNWVYVRTFKGSNERRDQFETHTAWFDAAWYGHEMPPLGPGGFDAIRQNVADLLNGGQPSEA